MPIGWFVAPYNLRFNPDGTIESRYCAMDDFSPQIVADGGSWAESEVLGSYAVVKVKASQSTLDTIAATSGFFKLPGTDLTFSLVAMTASDEAKIKNVILSMGYTQAEIQTSLGASLAQKTLGDVVNFMATRRVPPRFTDANQNTLTFDSAPVACRMISDVDRAVK